MLLTNWLATVNKGTRRRNYRKVLRSKQLPVASHVEVLEDRTLLTPALIEARVVTELTPLDPNGEVAALPVSENAINEFDTFFVEFWVTTPDADQGITSAFIDLRYNTSLVTVMDITFGPAFDDDQNLTIDEQAGFIDAISGMSNRDNVGETDFALLARIEFGSEDPVGAPAQPDAGLFDLELGLSNASISLANDGPVLTRIGEPMNSELFTVPYDFNDDGIINFGDFSIFAGVFRDVVESSDSPFASVADFNDDGVINFGDFSFFAANFRNMQSSSVDLVFPNNFLETLRPPKVNTIARITEISPANGDTMVSLTRETIVRFDEEIDPATITADSFYVIANGERLAGRRVVSSTERFVTFFYDNPLPPSTEIRIVVDGDLIIGRDGFALDADGDNQAGGLLTADFRTLPLTRIPGTNVFGFVRDSFTEEPIVGATIRVDAFPEANVVTDENGRFELVDMPAPGFFVHVDGSTATNSADGFVYPNVGKPFHSVPGQSVQLEMNREVFDIFLPLVALADVQPLSSTETTNVGFGAQGKAELQQMFPDVDPAMFDLMQVGFAPGGAVDKFGNPATTAAIIPVPPDRIPAPLPPNLNPELVISIQAEGATNFDVPAPITFPNLEGLAPGEKSLTFSFNHDAGRWDVIGTGTVSEDGLAIVSDLGVGILAPGWHFTAVGSFVDGSAGHEDEVLDPAPPILVVKDLDDTPGDKVLFFSKPGGKPWKIVVSNGGGKVLHVKKPELMGTDKLYFDVKAKDDSTPGGYEITVTARDPQVTDNANWKKLKGTAFYVTTLTISADNGMEEKIKLVSFLDTGDDAVDGTIKVNTTAVGVTQKDSLLHRGDPEVALSYESSGSPFGVSGVILKYTPTSGGPDTDTGVIPHSTKLLLVGNGVIRYTFAYEGSGEGTLRTRSTD